MNNKNGFTLIEVLAVIIMLSGILVITISAILGSVNSANETIRKSKIEALRAVAYNYAEDNINKFGQCISTQGTRILSSKCLISFDTLISNGYIDAENEILIDPKTKTRFIITLLVCYDLNKSEINIKSYEHSDIVSYSCN